MEVIGIKRMNKSFTFIVFSGQYFHGNHGSIFLTKELQLISGEERTTRKSPFVVLIDHHWVKPLDEQLLAGEGCQGNQADSPRIHYLV